MRISERIRTWLFQTGRADPTPIVLRQRRIFILPTRDGVFYATVLVAMYLSAVNYNLGLGHALVFLMVALGLTGLVYSFRNLHELRIIPGRIDPVFVGETARLALRVENDRATCRAGLAIAVDGGPTLVEFAVPAQGATSIEIPIEAKSRGWHPVGRLRLSTTYPLGVTRAWSYPHPDTRCLVYPHPVSRPLPMLCRGDKPGLSGALSGEDDFSGFRLRRPGDPPRHIAWKAFARAPDSRPLLVKQFTGAAEPELWLRWDMVEIGTPTELRLSVLAGWVLAAEAEGARYGLELPDCTCFPGRGEAHLADCLSRLATFEGGS